MKIATIIFTFFVYLNICFGQQELNDSIFQYHFANELRYKEIKSGNDKIYVQFNDSIVKITLPFLKGEEGFVLIDDYNKFIVTNFNSNLDLKKFDELPTFNENEGRQQLVKIDNIKYKEYECQRFHIKNKESIIELYFENKPTPNFNKLIGNLLLLRGIKTSSANLPQGRFVAGMEIKNGVAKDTIELIQIKENQEINFTLNIAE